MPRKLGQTAACHFKPGDRIRESAAFLKRVGKAVATSYIVAKCECVACSKGLWVAVSLTFEIMNVPRSVTETAVWRHISSKFVESDNVKDDT